MNIIDNLRNKYNGFFGPIPDPDKWVFIVSCYNSGSTLLHQILAQHPQIGSMPGEGQFYTDQLLLPKKVNLPRLWALEPELFYLDESNGRNINIDVLKKQWGARINNLERPIIIEKSPTNAGRTRWLQKYFDNAYFVGIVRNGYAVSEGIRRKSGHPLKKAAQQWLQSNEIMLRDFNYLKKSILISYEDLTDNPETTLAGILKFLDLESFNNEVISRVWNIHEKNSEITNMNSLSINRLNDLERLEITEVAGEMLHRLGYLDF